MYKLLIRPIVRRMKPERADRFALGYFKLLGMIPGGRFLSRLVHGNKPQGLEREVFGLQFYNPVGLGAGLDSRGELYNDLNDLGFSFVEIGPLDVSGTRHAIENIQEDPQNDILAACITSDYLRCFSLAYDFMDMFVIELPAENPDITILDDVLEARLTYEDYKPVVAKFPENLDKSQLEAFTDYCSMNNVDGIEVRSMAQIMGISARTKGRLPIIANCHISTPQEAEKMLGAGASLIAIHTGLVHQGPSLVSKTLKYLEKLAENERK